MNIKKFAAKPKLVEVSLDSEDILAKYGEAITFYTRDLVSMEVYMGFFGSQSQGQFDNLALMVRKMILDEKGNEVLAPDEDLPMDIAAAAIAKLSEVVGQSLPTVAESDEEKSDKK